MFFLVIKIVDTPLIFDLPLVVTIILAILLAVTLLLPFKADTLLLLFKAVTLLLLFKAVTLLILLNTWVNTLLITLLLILNTLLCIFLPATDRQEKNVIIVLTWVMTIEMDPLEILRDIYKNVRFRILLKGYILENFQYQWKLIFDLYILLAEGPGFALGKKKTLKKEKFDFLVYVTPRQPMSVHKKCQSIRSSRLAGYTQHIYIRMSCFII